jgi:CheY-like chemotaxis protein
MLERTEGLPESVRADVRLIRRNIELEARLIDDLLDLTRVANGKLLLALESVDVHETIEAVLTLFRDELEHKQLRVTTALSARRHWVRADRARLQQMLWNLLRNAAKFTPASGVITLRTRDAVLNAGDPEPREPAEGACTRDPLCATQVPTRGQTQPIDESIAIEVEDTGIGIEPERLPRLFNAFEQGSDAISRAFGGLGLGLAITRALTDAHGGHVSAQSDGPGRGARFTLRLPLAPEPVAARHADDRGAQAAARTLRILLIEDHEDTAEVMARLLESYGHEVKIVGRLDEANAACKGDAFDLVISDLGLPDGSGLEFIRAYRRTSAAPAVALTGYGMDDDVRRCLDAGFSAHLTKPVSIQQLEQLLADISCAP